MECSEINNYLSKFKNIHENKKGIILGTGNTLNQYIKTPDFDDAIHFGVNGVAQHEHSKLLDYYFIADRNTSNSTYIDRSTKQAKKEIINLKCIKLFGQFRHAKILWPKSQKHICLTEQDIIDNSAIPFEIGCKKRGSFPQLVKEINKYCFGGFQSVIWYAIQFALFTGINEIYIVGCDLDNTTCLSAGSNQKNNRNVHLIKFWKNVKKFIQLEYPSVKIVIINPIGLAKLFPNHLKIQGKI